MFEKEEVKAIIAKYGKVARRPRTLLLKASDNINKEYAEKLLEEEKLDYPIIIKSNKAFHTKFCHAKYFINDSDGFDEMYKNTEFLKEDLEIEELIPHNKDKLIKIHTIGDYAMFWRIDQSIPEGFFDENAFIIHKSDCETTPQEHESKCTRIPAEMSEEDRFNIEFIQEISKQVVKQFDISFMGFDFVISEKDDTFVLIDVNYFVPYKRCIPARVTAYFNEFMQSKMSEKA